VRATLALISILLIPIIGCGRAGGDRPTELVVWAMGAEGERLHELIPAFEARHPGIRVRVQRIPWIAAHEKLLTGYAGEVLPDIAQLGNTWIPEFVALDALEDLGPWLVRSPDIDPDDFFPGIWRTNVMNERLYGIPWYVDTRVLFYRTDLLREAGFEEPPRSWAEFRAAAEGVRAGSAGRYGIFLPTNEWVPAVVFGLQQHSALLRDGDQYGAFSEPEFRRAFDYLVQFYRDGLSPAGATEILNLYQAFADGVFAMYITGPWQLGEFARRLPADVQDLWTTAPLPAPDGGVGASVAGGASLVIFRSSERKEEAWKFITFMAEPEQQIAFYRATGNLPPRQSAWEQSGLAGEPRARAFYEQLQRVQPTPMIPEWERIAMRIQHYAEVVALNRMSVDEALSRLDRDVDRILAKRRWLIENFPERWQPS
jgi:multiple sugar transport system substrate-binding protein